MTSSEALAGLSMISVYYSENALTVWLLFVCTFRLYESGKVKVEKTQLKLRLIVKFKIMTGWY